MGHYYFSELLAPLRERYLISGEINSEVEDMDRRRDEVLELIRS